jgi:hypothetical protein
MKFVNVVIRLRAHTFFFLKMIEVNGSGLEKGNSTSPRDITYTAEVQ